MKIKTGEDSKDDKTCTVQQKGQPLKKPELVRKRDQEILSKSLEEFLELGGGQTINIEESTITIDNVKMDLLDWLFSDNDKED